MSKGHRKVDEEESFGLSDIARIIAGLLLVNCILSYAFTSSTTWGYEGRWIDPHYVNWKLTGNYVNLTLEQLSQYDGSNSRLPIYIGINGKVYDVTRSSSVYGPKGPYGFFSGKDGARAFSTGCFNKPDEFTYDLRGLDLEVALKDIANWQKFFENSDKYWYVGTVIHEPITGDPPAPCHHVKFPGYKKHP
ncbi:cytochrome b5 [Yamadazyma tenuis ATCC 10573]|uniref:Cytochrome b5 n=1 Tax=Candida tenuis (strain ATCC 10573 / BCRC 21748 / CBS 615 / JCM 9827 / NBRC 10315 / NRRL Y-1498 / VKM Y-70) TaxID=590646 RepID=G3AY63_CANTC|nr:cytochrome b5 [Yamadazyma tenuis ATCC 10573]EGV65777.1 cytochrome b5 [Yamadazyma tenuis ATCC 10573]